jgi:hypothetical protein
MDQGPLDPNTEIMLQNAVEAVMERELARMGKADALTLAFMGEVHRRCANIYEAKSFEAEALEDDDGGRFST